MNYQEIEAWLNGHDIKHYTISENLSVDVDGDVWLVNRGLTKFPFQFREVAGNFMCPCNSLTSLKYAPMIVGMRFYCHVNELTSLQYAPSYVGGSFWCSHNNLTSVKYLPDYIGGDIKLGDNPFEITEDNEREWMDAIVKNSCIYEYITNPSDKLKAFYKMLYEV